DRDGLRDPQPRRPAGGAVVERVLPEDAAGLERAGGAGGPRRVGGVGQLQGVPDDLGAFGLLGTVVGAVVDEVGDVPGVDVLGGDVAGEQREVAALAFGQRHGGELVEVQVLGPLAGD